MENETRKKLEEIFTMLFYLKDVREKLYRDIVSMSIPVVIDNFVETTGHTEEDLLEAFRNIESPEELQQIVNSFVQIDFTMGQIDKIRESARNVINDLTDEGQ